MRPLPILLPLLVSIAAGCGGGGPGTKNVKNPPASGGGPGGGSGGGGIGAPSIDVTTVPGLPATFNIRFDVKDAPVQVLNVRAIGGDFTVKALSIQAAGTIDDATDVSAVRIALDNGDGTFDKARDSYVGGAARFTANNGTAIVGGINKTIAAGASETWWVVYDMAGTAEPGETLSASIARASDVDALDAGGQPAAVTGFPANGPQGLVFVADSLLLSEIAVTPTNGEFVEIFNPTAQTVDLSNYYVTDAESNTQTALAHYYNLPTGQNHGKCDGFDFHVRFPAGATIQPGQYVTVAVDSSLFQSQFGRNPSFEMVQDGAADGVPDMRLVGPAPASFTGIGLSNGAEIVVLYTWDGTADLVTDVDLIQWGSDITAFHVNKTAVAIDGPDQDTTAGAYRADSAMIMQDSATPNQIGTSMKRVDFTEYGENKAGGNGFGGNDETSENFGITWSAMTAPTPGAK